MADYIWENGRQVAYIKDDFAFDLQNVKRYRIDGTNLIHLQSGEVIGHLTPMGQPGTVDKPGLFEIDEDGTAR